MKVKSVKTLATVLFILLFFMPLIVTLMMSASATKDAQQYSSLQFLVMGFYNLPFVVVSSLALIVGLVFSARLKEKASDIAFLVSIASSIVGNIFMVLWGLGSLG